MQDVLVVGIVFFSIYKIIELVVLQKERKFMVEKMTHISPELLQSNMGSMQTSQNSKFLRNPFIMLRLGACSLGVGIGWILGRLLYEVMKQSGADMRGELDSTILASVALFAGIALIVVYLIERKALKESKKGE